VSDTKLFHNFAPLFNDGSQVHDKINTRFYAQEKLRYKN